MSGRKVDQLIIILFGEIIMFSHFLNNNMDKIVVANIFWLISMTAIYILVITQSVSKKSLVDIFNSILYYGIVVGESVILILAMFVFIINVKEQKPLDHTLPIYSTTNWISEEIPIYLISNNKLIVVDAKGTERTEIFNAGEAIREYHFSPDGKYILIISKSKLFLFNQENKKSSLIDSLNIVRPSMSEEKVEITGVISGVKWDPNSSKFCYKLARWSKYASQEYWYIYDLDTKKTSSIKTPTRKISELTWSQDGKMLYYIWFDALDTSISSDPYEIKIYKITFPELKPELALRAPYNEPSLPYEYLELKDIYIYTAANRLSFGIAGQKSPSLISEKGSKVGIDEKDRLYYTKHFWWKKRLYLIPRVPDPDKYPKHQYRGGDLVIKHLRWLPGDRYVIMEHYLFGVLILEPASGKLGILVNDRGNTFGWYAPLEGPYDSVEIETPEIEVVAELKESSTRIIKQGIRKILSLLR